MKIVRPSPPKEGASVPALSCSISEAELRGYVERFSVPRHFQVQKEENHRVADEIAALLTNWGYQVEVQGEYRNIVALPREPEEGPLRLVGAHYDSVANTPGADDNASGIAVLLACAREQASIGEKKTVWVAFNAEEEGFLGSENFVRHLTRNRPFLVSCAYILEMVGYCSREPGSQRTPPSLPLRLSEAGDFLGVLSNQQSNGFLDELIAKVPQAAPSLSVLGLKTFLGVDRWLPVLHRSDHSPFWGAGIPALLLTDTAEFRNPNYHRPWDTPDTLDYSFMREVAALLCAVLS